MKTIIHVNQHIIKANAKTGGRDAPLTVKDYKQNRRASTAKIIHDGKVIAEIVYSPDKPLSCGARVWISTECEVQTEDESANPD